MLLGSKHINAQREFNEFNPGLFFSWDCELVNIRIGLHKNSFSDPSTSVTFTSEFLSLSFGDANIHPFVGIARYPETGRDLPVSIEGSDVIGLMGLEFTHNQFPVFIQYLPGDTKLGDYAHLFTIGFKFGL